MRKILLSGYYGYNNAGDEAILKSILQNLKKIDDTAMITVLSDNIEFTREKYGINAVKRFNIIHIVKALLNCDILISGGGTLFQDKTSTRSLIYYTSIINIAKILGKKVMIYANGIGPLEKKKNILRVKKSIENSDIVTLRDKEAIDLVKSMNVKNKNIFLTTDPVFCLESYDDEIADDIMKKYNIDINKKNVVVCVRSWEKEGIFTDVFAKICDYIAENYNKNIIFIPMQHPHDINATNVIQSKMKKNSYMIEDITPTTMMSIMKKSEYVLSMRLHGLIFSASVHTPCIGFSYDPKIDNILKQIDMPLASRIEDMSYEDIKNHIDDIEKNIDTYKEKIKTSLEKVRELSVKNFEYMKKMLNY